MILIIPKSLPVSFWLNGKKTFNDTSVPNTTKSLFHQKIQLTDNVQLQFRTDVTKVLVIRLFNVKTGIESANIPLVQTIVSSGVYLHEVNFRLLDKGVANGDVVALRLYKIEQISTASIAMQSPGSSMNVSVTNGVTEVTATIVMTSPSSSIASTMKKKVTLATNENTGLYGGTYIITFDDSNGNTDTLYNTDVGLLNNIKSQNIDAVVVWSGMDATYPYVTIEWYKNGILQHSTVITSPSGLKGKIITGVLPGDTLSVEIYGN